MADQGNFHLARISPPSTVVLTQLFSFDHEAWLSSSTCCHVESPRALVPSNKRIISVGADYRSRRKFLCFLLLLLLRSNQSKMRNDGAQEIKKQKHLYEREREREREKKHEGQKGKLHFNLIAQAELETSTVKTAEKSWRPVIEWSGIKSTIG